MEDLNSTKLRILDRYDSSYKHNRNTWSHQYLVQKSPHQYLVQKSLQTFHQDLEVYLDLGSWLVLVLHNHLH
ncbi:hypothetical protein EYF80_046878 [Liparis tanakae]|uniref:Uncharacterized protein n=1 Tax=Liparis tanakae TaxID=230148 RepID=A0A4Z2FPX8_9TELE|nr:hypothetical protein EYF80_046878 [Liparis tanakae]